MPTPTEIAKWLTDFERETLGSYNGDPSSISEILKNQPVLNEGKSLFTAGTFDAILKDTKEVWKALQGQLIKLKTKYGVKSCYLSDNSLPSLLKKYPDDRKKNQLAIEISRYVCGVRRGDSEETIAGLVVGYCINTPVFLVLDKWKDNTPWKIKHLNRTFKEAFEIPDSAVECDGGRLLLLTLIPERPVYLPMFQSLDHFNLHEHNLSRKSPGLVLSVDENGEMNVPEMHLPIADDAHYKTAWPKSYSIKFDTNGSLQGLTDDIGRPIFDDKIISKCNAAAIRFFEQVYEITRLDSDEFDQLIQFIISEEVETSNHHRQLLNRFNAPKDVIRYHFPLWALLHIRKRIENMEGRNLLLELNRSLKTINTTTPHPNHPLLLFLLLCDKTNTNTHNRKITTKVLYAYYKPIVDRYLLDGIDEKMLKILKFYSDDKNNEVLSFNKILSLIFGDEGHFPAQEDQIRGVIARQWGADNFRNIRELYHTDDKSKYSLKGLLAGTKGELFTCLDQGDFFINALNSCINKHEEPDTKEAAHAISLTRIWMSESKKLTHVTDRGWLLETYSTKKPIA